MTVLAEKSTLLPDRFPRNLPCLPLSRWHSPRTVLGPRSCLGMPGVSPFMNRATCICRNSQSSVTIFMVAPFSRAILRALFISIISCSLTVRSSSVLPPPMSCGTEGRIGTGGTGTHHIINPSGLPYWLCIHSSVRSSSLMRFSMSQLLRGVKSSTAFCMVGFNSGWARAISAMCLAWIRDSPSSFCGTLALNFSCTILKHVPVSFFTTPLQ
mmetsp:Transcript_26243/g.58082  ORF Transcript_26243/g.58082 Transcript_26243/m.58082 type:complete len:212 (+) Transcript_26243:1854-2489(+)